MAEYNGHFIKCLLENIPNYIFWKDENLVFMWCNKQFAQQFGYNNPDEIIGKTDYDFPWSSDLRDKYIRDDKEVLSSSGDKINYEEQQRQPDGNIKTLLVSKTPIHNETDKIVGILGIYIDITDRKEKEHLQIETQLQQIKITDQEIFRKDVGQLIHDVNTPIATIQLILELIKNNIPESERITLRDAVGSIKGITGNLLSKYKKDQNEDQNSTPTLISLLLTQVLEERKIRSANVPIEFSYDFDNCPFAFININQLAIKRTITNLINNAVDAIDRTGAIHLSLSKNNGLIAITIKDNGKGMSPEILSKLRSNIAVTSGKENGYGIGFTQINETIKNNCGVINIESTLNQGTTITLVFPETPSPDWLVQELHFSPKDIVIVLDDDSSIHGAWDAVFQKYQDAITIKHFTQGSEAIAFINAVPNKNQIFLLADFELLKQDLNGVDVIKQTGARSILVTSHYTDKKVLRLVKDNNLKLLPKQLAAKVTVSIVPIA